MLCRGELHDERSQLHGVALELPASVVHALLRTNLFTEQVASRMEPCENDSIGEQHGSAIWY